MKPTVSIITPSYNRVHTLPRCWESIERQTFTDFRWVVVDDGSADGTADWVKGLINGTGHRLGDRRVVYCWQKNQGANAARNLGMKYAASDASEYVIFLDSDDAFYQPTSLAEMVAEIRAVPKDIGVVAFPVVDDKGRRRFDNLTQKRLVADYAAKVCDTGARGEFFSILRQEVSTLAPFPEYRGVEDVRHLAIARHTKILFVNKPMRIYYDYKESGTGDNSTALAGFLAGLEAMASGTRDILAQHKTVMLAHCPPRYSRYCSSLALYYLLDGKTGDAISPLIDAVRYGNAKLKLKALVVAGLLILPRALRLMVFKLAWRFR